MRKFAITVLTCLSLQGCWFVFIPGSVMSKVGDTITGAEGENCVGAAAKVGDRVSVPGQPTLVVISLSGTSSGCKDPNFPIRAKLGPI